MTRIGTCNRRSMMLGSLVTLTAGAAQCRQSYGGMLANYASSANRKFSIDLCPGRIGVQADQMQTIEFASRYGFESVEPLPGEITSLSEQARRAVSDKLAEKHLRWGAASLDVDFRNTQATFAEGMKELGRAAKALQAVDVTRMGTWISPMHQERTYTENFNLHRDRLREIGRLLADHGIRFGLEYVGPKTLWSSRRYPFIHTLRETQELIAAIDVPTVGLILDSWHWYCAGETVDDLLKLKNEMIVAVDLNDAPAGIERDKQIDNQRELPAATGVIDLPAFVAALRQLDYDGPVRAEPFNKPLNEMDNESGVEATAAAMKRAIS